MKVIVVRLKLTDDLLTVTFLVDAVLDVPAQRHRPVPRHRRLKRLGHHTVLQSQIL